MTGKYVPFSKSHPNNFYPTMTQDEKAKFDAAVQAEAGKLMAAQQAQFAQMMEAAMKQSLQGVDHSNDALNEARDAVRAELDAAQEARAKAEREGEKMAQEYFEGKREQFSEAAKTELLRNLTRMHLEMGAKSEDIAGWLNVPVDFVENIRVVLDRNNYSKEKPKRLQLEGNPKLRYSDSGRGGTIYFESATAKFDLWWEFAGGDALVIVDIPTVEQWETRTKLPLDQRNAVITFIGEQIVEDKISGRGSFIVGANVLTFFAG